MQYMRSPTVYIFINKSLNMSVGKVAAQAAHAMSLVPNLASKQHWLSGPPRTVIILQARDEQQLSNIRIYLSERSIDTYSVVDEGVNEVDEYVMTAMATGVLDKTDVAPIFKRFKVYRDTVRVRLEIDK
jgi:peptidyl-tRNA hydrolase